MNYYIKNNSFLKEITKCQKENKVSSDLIIYFDKIIDKQIFKYINKIDSFYDDLKSDVMLHCIEIYQKFDTNKTNSVFAFYTSVINNKAITLIKKHSKLKNNTVYFEDLNK